MECSIPVGSLAIYVFLKNFQTLIVHLSTKISIGKEMFFSSNFDKMSKWDTDSHKSKDFLLNPICVMCIILCLYMLFKVYK